MSPVDPPGEEDQAHSMARRAARGTLATFALRFVSFVCTQYTLRVLDPSTLGRALVQLDLLLSTVLFVSREGFRLALTRNTTNDSWNVAWCSIPVVTLVSVLVLFWWHWHAAATDMDGDFYWAGVLYCIACCVEGWAEPAVLWSLRQLEVTTKASAEGLATVGKTVTTVLVLQRWRHDWPVTAFGVAQLAYAVLYAAALYRQTGKHLVTPTRSSWAALDPTTTRLVAVFTVQGLFKHLLTEGDRIVLTMLSGTYDQGVYAMGSAYGGMAARLILQPLEENARLLWSRLAVVQPTAAQLDQLRETYTVLVKLVVYIGCVFGCIAVNYTTVVLKLLAGRKWGSNQEATDVLTAFCVYTAFLACNGMTEAFVYAVASSGSDMGRLGAAHTVVGLVFTGVASVTVSRYGAVGLVAASCLAMFCRSTYSVLYAARYFSQRDPSTFRSTLRVLLLQMFPDRWVVLTFIAVYWTTRWSNMRMQHQVEEFGDSAWLTLAAGHVTVGVAAAVGLLAMAYSTELHFLRSFSSMWATREAKADRGL